MQWASRPTSVQARSWMLDFNASLRILNKSLKDGQLGKRGSYSRHLSKITRCCNLPALLQLMLWCHAVKGFDILGMKCNAVSFRIRLGNDVNQSQLHRVDLPGVAFTITLIRTTRSFWTYLLVCHLLVLIPPPPTYARIAWRLRGM